MRSYEVHHVETVADIDLLMAGGLSTPERFAQTECDQCGTPLGFSFEHHFEPFLIIIDSEDFEWPICLTCGICVVGELLEDDVDPDTEELEFF